MQTQLDRAALREEIKDVLAETFSAVELFDEPKEKAAIEIVRRCADNNYSYMTNGSNAADYANAHAALRATIRGVVREYFQTLLTSQSQNAHNLPY